MGEPSGDSQRRLSTFIIDIDKIGHQSTIMATKLDQLNPPLHITQLRPATASGEEIESAHSLIDADPTAGLQHDDLPADTVAQLGANF